MAFAPVVGMTTLESAIAAGVTFTPVAWDIPHVKRSPVLELDLLDMVADGEAV